MRDPSSNVAIGLAIPPCSLHIVAFSVYFIGFVDFHIAPVLAAYLTQLLCGANGGTTTTLPWVVVLVRVFYKLRCANNPPAIQLVEAMIVLLGIRTSVRLPPTGLMNPQYTAVRLQLRKVR